MISSTPFVKDQHAEEMHEVGYNMRLMRTVFGWRADFCRDEHTRLIRWIADASGRTAPWRAVQLAALETLRREGEPSP